MGVSKCVVMSVYSQQSKSMSETNKIVFLMQQTLRWQMFKSTDAPTLINTTSSFLLLQLRVIISHLRAPVVTEHVFFLSLALGNCYIPE